MFISLFLAFRFFLFLFCLLLFSLLFFCSNFLSFLFLFLSYSVSIFIFARIFFFLFFFFFGLSFFSLFIFCFCFLFSLSVFPFFLFLSSYFNFSIFFFHLSFFSFLFVFLSCLLLLYLSLFSLFLFPVSFFFTLLYFFMILCFFCFLFLPYLPNINLSFLPVLSSGKMHTVNSKICRPIKGLLVIGPGLDFTWLSGPLDGPPVGPIWPDYPTDRQALQRGSRKIFHLPPPACFYPSNQFEDILHFSVILHKILPIFKTFFSNSFCSQGPVLRPGFYTLCTTFDRMPGCEPELLRLQPEVTFLKCYEELSLLTLLASSHRIKR